MDGIKSCVSSRENGSRCRVEFCTRVTKIKGRNADVEEILLFPGKRFRGGNYRGNIRSITMEISDDFRSLE